MPKRLFSFAVMLIFLFAFVSPANALFNNDVKKAKEFMTAGMYPQAVELLNKRINDKPTDAEAHFQLGICYIITGNYGGADERFGSAVRLKSDYGFQIGGEYKKAGSTALSKGQVSQSQNLFAKAVEYQPNLRKEVAQDCFTAGKSYMNRGQSSVADGLFSVASRYDGSLANEINQITTAYGKRLLETAKNRPKGERRRYIDEAKKYLPQNEIDAVIPPPGWSEVYRKSFVGVGFTGGDEPKDNDGTVHTAKFGENIKIGDKIIVETYGNNIEVWNRNKWMKYEDPIINQAGTSGYFVARAVKGKKFIVVVERYIETY